MLFRTEVIEARRRRLWGEVRLSQPPGLIAWTAVLSGTAALMICGLTFGSVLQKETVHGYLAPVGGIVQLSSQRSGQIVKVLVAEGDHVAHNTPLVELSGESVGLTTGNVLGAQIDQIDQQVSDVNTRRQASRSGLDSETRRLRNQITSQTNLVDLLNRRLSDQQQIVEISARQLDRYSSLIQKGYVSQVQVDQLRQQILTQKGVMSDMQREVSSTRANISDLKFQLESLRSRNVENSAGMDNDLSLLKQKRIDLLAIKSFMIKAPVDGIVSNLQAEVGQTPVPNSLLASLMPDGAKIQAELLVPTRAAGFIIPGQEVRLQIDAFNFQRFGFVMGHVVSVSKSALRPGDYLAPIPVTESVYRVQVALDKNAISAYGIKRPLRPGMTLSADIIIDRKPIWNQLLDPLFAAGKRMH